MERESFSDPEIARQLNEGFVCVKVDREERPDVDEIYMTATQLITRSGGWPNSVFLTPDLKPFFAGTYFPPARRHGPARLPARAAGAARGLALPARRAAAAGRGWWPRRWSSTSAGPRRRRRRRCPAPERRDGRAGGPRRALRPGVGRLRSRAQVPLAREPLLPPRPRGRRRGPRDAGDDARPDGARRPDGPAGRRLPPLLDRRGVARAALREDAVRQRRARAALRRGVRPRARRRASSGWPGSPSTSSCAR